MSELLREFVELLLTEKIRGSHGESESGQFDLNLFKKLPTSSSPDLAKLATSRDRNQASESFRTKLGKLIDYADSHLQFVGAGSSRNVYTLSSRKVLKIATSDKGLGQNEAEVDVFTNPKSKPIVTRIYDYDPNYFWIISELIRPFENDKTDEINDMLGLGIQTITFEEFADSAARGYFDMIKRYGAEHLIDFAEQINDIVKKNGLLVGDIKKGSSWGKSVDGRLVLLDYGYTYDVADNFY